VSAPIDLGLISDPLEYNIYHFGGVAALIGALVALVFALPCGKKDARTKLN
jgi:hypothetical protein